MLIYALLCCDLLNRDHPEATQQMNDLIIVKVSAALKGHWANPDLVRGHVAQWSLARVTNFHCRALKSFCVYLLWLCR